MFLPPLPPTFDAALRDAGSPRPEARLAAARSLGAPPEGREAEARAALAPLLDDAVGPIRAVAVEAFGELGGDDALDRVLAAFEDPDFHVRQTAVHSAARLGGPEASAAVTRALDDPRPELRFVACVVLGELAPDAALPSLAARLEDEDPQVRAAAASALGAFDAAEGALDGLGRLLEDPDPEARFAAATTLAGLADDRAAPVLAAFLASADHQIEAALALGRLRSAAAVPALAELAQRVLASRAAVAAAGAALVQLGDPRGVPALRAALTAFRSDGRSFAVELAGEHEVVELVPELARLARRPRRVDPVILERALARLAPRSPEAHAALEELRRHAPAGDAPFHRNEKTP